MILIDSVRRLKGFQVFRHSRHQGRLANHPPTYPPTRIEYPKLHRARTIAMKDAEEVHDNPPWFARHPNGKINCGGVPDRLLNHPELQRRGIVLRDSSKPV